VPDALEGLLEDVALRGGDRPRVAGGLSSRPDRKRTGLVPTWAVAETRPTDSITTSDALKRIERQQAGNDYWRWWPD
jgi:hypothetical protein